MRRYAKRLYRRKPRYRKRTVIRRRTRGTRARRIRGGQPTGTAIRNSVSEQRSFKPTDGAGNEIKIQPVQVQNYANYGTITGWENFSAFRDDFSISKDPKYTLMKDYRLYEKVTVAGVKVKITLDRPTIMNNGAEIFPTVYLATACQEQQFRPDPSVLQTTKEFRQFKLTKTGYSAKIYIPALVRERKTYAGDYLLIGDEGRLDANPDNVEAGGDGGLNYGIDKWSKLPYMSMDDPDHLAVKWGQYACVVDWGTPPAVGTLTVASAGSMRIEYRYYYKLKNLKYNVF